MRLPRWWPWVSRRRHRRALDQMHRNMLAGFEAVERQRDEARAEVERLEAEVGRLRGTLEHLAAEMIEPDGMCYPAGDGLVEQWADSVWAALEDQS